MEFKEPNYDMSSESGDLLVGECRVNGVNYSKMRRSDGTEYVSMSSALKLTVNYDPRAPLIAPNDKIGDLIKRVEYLERKIDTLGDSK